MGDAVLFWLTDMNDDSEIWLDAEIFRRTDIDSDLGYEVISRYCAVDTLICRHRICRDDMLFTTRQANIKDHA